MARLSLQQLKVVDPVLTSVVQRYTNQKFVGDYLFPRVYVDARSGRLIKWGKHNFAQYRTRRAPGSPTNRRTIGSYDGNNRFELFQDSIEVEVTREELEEVNASQVPFNLQREAVEASMASIMLNLEIEQASLATNPANYDPTHVNALGAPDQFDDPASSIIRLFQVASETIRRKTGQRPNVAVFSPQALLAACDHPEIRAYLAPTSSAKATIDDLARILGLERIYEGASVLIDPVDPTETFEDIWSNSVTIAIVPNNVISRKSLSYGYTYTLKNYPVAEEPYIDRNHKCWYFPATSERSPEITSIDAGYLMTNVTSSYPL